VALLGRQLICGVAYGMKKEQTRILRTDKIDIWESLVAHWDLINCASQSWKKILGSGVLYHPFQYSPPRNASTLTQK